MKDETDERTESNGRVDRYTCSQASRNFSAIGVAFGEKMRSGKAGND